MDFESIEELSHEQINEMYEEEVKLACTFLVECDNGITTYFYDPNNNSAVGTVYYGAEYFSFCYSRSTYIGAICRSCGGVGLYGKLYVASSGKI